MIEDASQAIGVRYRNKMAGTFNDISFYSLTKGMRNFGGGIITTNSEYHFKNILKTKKELFKKTRYVPKRAAFFPINPEFGKSELDKITHILLN